IIQFSLPNARVLDLFAGTGQLGIEALSRGARYCIFVDAAFKSVRTIQKNLQATRLAEHAQVIQKDFRVALETISSQKFDLILLDPPYGGAILNEALKKIAAFDILTTDGI